MKPRSKLGRWLLPIVVVATLYLANAYFFHQLPFAERKAVLEDVVHQIRRMHLKPGEDSQFRMDDLADAKSLHRVEFGTYFNGSSGSKNAGDVSAIVTPGGSLKVEIVTYDWHHFGSTGFAYSDDRLVPEPDGDGFPWIDLPGGLTCPNPATEIEPHWWKVHSVGD